MNNGTTLLIGIALLLFGALLMDCTTLPWFSISMMFVGVLVISIAGVSKEENK